LIPEAGRAAIGEAKAIVLSYTGWPTLDLVPDLQRELGKPVFPPTWPSGSTRER